MIKLYQFTVSYLRDQKHLHNLLFAFNTDRFQTTEEYLERYPGNDFVDIVGFDIYQRGDDNAKFIQEIDHTLTLLESIAKEKNKIPALTEFGYGKLPDSTWWTSTFWPGISNHKIAYALAWRNAGLKKDGSLEFYVPYKGQASANDFKKFYAEEKTLFQKDLTYEKLY